MLFAVGVVCSPDLGKALADLLQKQRLYDGLKLDQLATSILASLAHVYRRMGDHVKAEGRNRVVAEQLPEYIAVASV